MATDKLFLEALVRRFVGPDLDLSRFQCNENIDWYLRERACQYHEKRISTVTCWMDGVEIAGYIATSMSQIELKASDDRKGAGLAEIKFVQTGPDMKRFPAFLIGMLGVNKAHGRRGLGFQMVQHAIGQAVSLSEGAGCRFVIVDADRSPEAVNLYQKAGFKSVTGQDPDRGTLGMYFDLGPRTGSTP